MPPVPAPTPSPPSCFPSPCGPNSQCQIMAGNPACSCLPDYIGAPPSCRPECVLSAECLSQLACINQKCQDPCPGSCGYNANCHVLNHIPVCLCNEGHTGDPFTQCSPIPPSTPPPRTDPCNPSPCGPNAVCRYEYCRCNRCSRWCDVSDTSNTVFGSGGDGGSSSNSCCIYIYCIWPPI